ncbi:hypothetical protein [Streptomyces avicenniae]|uniref:hypothetical protein n=1 Tax=Streptomyces avicenniae TaxID=500153 RepID=UPI001CBA5FF5|nr:hypothetical protein [Streptomyces avicenniae]
MSTDDNARRLDVLVAIEELKAALAAHNITLPSLGIDAMTFLGSVAPPLVELGRCNPETARKLTEALR